MITTIEVPVKKMREYAKIPMHGSEYAAGYDLFACPEGCEYGEIYIEPHSTVKIETGVAAALPEGFFGAIFARSGLASKKGLRPANAVGVVDSDYRGEIIVALHNDTDTTQSIKVGERIAQLVLIPYAAMAFKETDDLDKTERGEGGFGSTGFGFEVSDTELPCQTSIPEIVSSTSTIMFSEEQKYEE